MFKTKIKLPSNHGQTHISKSAEKRKSKSMPPEMRPNKVAKMNNCHADEAEVRQEEPKFTFEEVKTMIEKLLAKKPKNTVAVDMKRVDFEEIAANGHSVEGCKELLEQLAHHTRRTRTTEEVFLDIKENLKKRTYTEIIQRASLKGDLPKKPPSAYLLYHQDRYNELRSENMLAVEVSKIVAEEWKTLSNKKKREYQRRHDEMVKNYELEMMRLGLVDDAAPKRPKSAKALFIEDNLNNYQTDEWTKQELAAKKEELGQEFENLDSKDKQKWLQLHKQNQEQYRKEKEAYVESHPHLNHTGPDRKPRANEKAKLPEMPKSALKYFIQKKMPDGLEGAEYDEKKKHLKEKFARLKEKKLLKYIKKAINDKERYDRELEIFKKEYPDREIPKLKANVSKNQWKLYDKLVENRPSLPAPTAYLHYCGKLLTDMNHNDDEQVPTARMQSASIAWQQSSDKERTKAQQEHIADIRRYITDMEVWLASKSDERRMQVLSEEPKANPDYWKKKLNRVMKQEKKSK